MDTWHIVYVSYESSSTGRDYVGKHSTTNLHDGYLGSYADVKFNPDSRIILGYYKTSEAAVAAEIQWQRVLGVVSDPQYANRSYQTAKGFDRTGLPHTEDLKQKWSVERAGTGNPMYGKTGDLAPATYMSWSYNPDTGDEHYGKDVPPGNELGRPSVGQRVKETGVSETTREKLRQTQLKIPPEERYWFGKEGNAKGTLWWRNPDTGEIKRSKSQPGPTWINKRK
jgi:hypothetical protein